MFKTQAMMISTQHLFPPSLPAAAVPNEVPTAAPNGEAQEIPLSSGAAQPEKTALAETVDSASGTFE